MLALTPVCHSLLRGVVELLRDLFDFPVSLGTVARVVDAAVAPARRRNAAQDLSGVGTGAHDEIYQAGRPVPAGPCSSAPTRPPPTATCSARSSTATPTPGASACWSYATAGCGRARPSQMAAGPWAGARPPPGPRSPAAATSSTCCDRP